jgi:hypothetical protein
VGPFIFEMLFFININQISTIKEGGKTMGTKRFKWIFVGCIAVAALFLGFVTEAKAETMKCRTAAIFVKEEKMPVGDLEGYTLGTSIREGMSFFENGEVANFKNYTIEDQSGGTGQTMGYTFYTFSDGSRIIVKVGAQTSYDPSGTRLTKAVNEIMKGTGRFEGIKGTTSTTAKSPPPVKGEFKKQAMDTTFTYTLPTK